jgi:hypothetical protein
MQALPEDFHKYIEKAWEHSHKRKDLKDVDVTLNEVDLADRIIQVNCDYIKNLYLRLGKALDPHLDVAKSHAASMKEAALAWQEKAIKSINDTAAALQKDNKRAVLDIESEASQKPRN